MTQEKCITYVHEKNINKAFTWMSIEASSVIVKTGNKPNDHELGNGLANYPHGGILLCHQKEYTDTCIIWDKSQKNFGKRRQIQNIIYFLIQLN